MTDDSNDVGARSRTDLEMSWSLLKCPTRYVKIAAKTLLPEVVTHEIRRYRAYTGTERALYLKIRALNAIGITDLETVQPPRTARYFLFVCFGNIMRSPMCEALMKRSVSSWARKITVASAGLNAHPGRAAHPWAVAAAKELGVSLEAHCAQLLTVEMVTRAEVIFAMDYHNMVQLRSRFPEAKNKVFMLGAYAGKNSRSFEIGDPYYSGEDGTRQCYKTLDVCIKNLVSSLPDN
jgi:protein-tyrosine phosphatase